MCILKAIKNWTWEEARLNLPLPTVAMTTSLILIGIIRLLFSVGGLYKSVYKVVTCLTVVRIEQTLVAVVDQCTCALGIVTVDS